MKKKCNNIYRQRWLKLFFIITVVYFSQIYPYIHIHHSHDEDILPFEISFHPLDIDFDHLPEHADRHDKNTHHTNDHQHTYDNQIDWHFIRLQNQRNLTSDDSYVFLSIFFIPSIKDAISNFEYEEFLYIDNNDVHSLIIRGPPLFG